jgi:diphthamide biosynthesis protein 4
MSTTGRTAHLAAFALGKGYTYYDILQLPHGGAEWNTFPKDEIKTAYRRALLVHHPDKIPKTSLEPSSSSRQPPPTPKYSIDEIVAAYEVLSDSAKRAAYDEALKRNEKDLQGQNGTHIGVEMYDLEDMVHDEHKDIWSKGCRCGDECGYILTVPDLEKESQHGEVYVGCRGCSLFIKVLFAVDED